MKYLCYWIDCHGEKKEEGVFKVASKNKKIINLEMVEVGEWCRFEDFKKRTLPRDESVKKSEYSTSRKYPTTNPQFWQDTIQVHHQQFGYPFIYEPIKK
jgi:hypothetical protein